MHEHARGRSRGEWLSSVFYLRNRDSIGAQPLESVGYIAMVLKFHVIQNWIVNFHQKLLAMVSLQNNNMTALLRIGLRELCSKFCSLCYSEFP